MSTHVDFYLLKEASEQASTLLACRLAEKAYLHNKTAYIYCDNENASIAVDQLLWTFKDDSFIPHARSTSSSAQKAPIVIGNDVSGDYDILINLHREVFPAWQKLTRILDVVGADPLLKERGRQRYKYYRDADCVLTVHEL